MDFEKKLANLQRKSIKYANAFHYKDNGLVYKEILNENGYPVMVSFRSIEIEGFVGATGWGYVGRVERLREHQNVVSSVGEHSLDLTKFNHCDIVCEHCGRDIRRHFTYIVHNTETGEFKQVGRNCLRDYTGIDLEYVAYLASLEKTVNNYTGGYKFNNREYIKIDEIVKILSECCRMNGGKYIKEANYKHKYTTIQTATTLYNIIERGYEYHEFVMEMAKKVDLNSEESCKILEKIRKYDGDNENLKVMINCSYVPFGFVSTIAEEVFKYYKDIDEPEEEIIDTEFYGNVGDKFDLPVDDFEYVGDFTTYVNDYVPVTTNIFKFYCGKHVLTWFTSKYFSKADVDVKSIKGTIKAHNTFRGVNETVVTRCRVVTVEKQVEEPEVHEIQKENPSLKALDDFIDYCNS